MAVSYNNLGTDLGSSVDDTALQNIQQILSEIGLSGSSGDIQQGDSLTVTSGTQFAIVGTQDDGSTSTVNVGNHDIAVVVANAGPVVLTGTGASTVYASNAGNSITLNSGDSTAIGGSGADTLAAGTAGGDHVLQGSGGNDLLIAGSGNDT